MPDHTKFIIDKLLKKKVIRPVKIFISRVFSGLFTFFAISFYATAAFFLLAGISGHQILLSIGASLLIFAIFFTYMAVQIQESIKPKYSIQHHKDIRACRDILEKVEGHIKNNRIGPLERKNIYRTMKKELRNAGKIAKKIDEILKHASRLTQELTSVSHETSATDHAQDKNDDYLVEKIASQKNDIDRLNERAQHLKEQIAKLRLNFNSIYTKLTLLDTEDTDNYDKIETEIQKILDFKLQTAQFEKELDKEYDA